MAKKKNAGKRPNARQTREAKLRSLFDRLPLTGVGPSLDDEQFDALEGVVCAFAFPADYRAFLRHRNGGDLTPAATFTWTHPSHGPQTSRLYGLYTLAPGPFDRPTRGNDHIAVTLRLRGILPQFALPVGSADDENILLTFEHGPRDGQVWIKVGDEVSVDMDDPWNPGEGLYPVANSFTEFVRGLNMTPSR